MCVVFAGFVIGSIWLLGWFGLVDWEYMVKYPRSIVLVLYVSVLFFSLLMTGDGVIGSSVNRLHEHLVVYLGVSSLVAAFSFVSIWFHISLVGYSYFFHFAFSVGCCVFRLSSCGSRR